MAPIRARVLSASALCPCKSGRRVGECHPSLSVAPDRNEFYATIERGLSACHLLPTVLPKGYPARGKAAIPYEKALLFEWERNKRYAHSINLPLLLHMVGNPQSLDNVKRYAAQTLNVFERFIFEFPKTDRMKTVLRPLWQQPWDAEPVFWSVLAHCHMAVGLKLGGNTILSFEAPTGKGNKTADIHFRSADGLSVLQDIEIWNAPEGATVESLRERLCARATAKAADKFGAQAPGTIFLVSQVAMPNDSVLRILHAHQGELMTPFMILPTVGAELAAFAAVGDEQGRQFGHDFLTFRSRLRPLLQQRVASTSGDR
jgi:hypothetical protein